MNIPNHRDMRVRVYVDRHELSLLADTDGTVLVDTDEAALATLPTYRVPIEITDRVRSGRVSLGDVSAIGSERAGVDATVAVLNLTLDHGSPSLAPGADSPLNEPDELLRPYRRVRVVAEEPGDDPRTIFAGYLGDEIRSSATAGRASITLTARDLAKPLQDTFLSEFPVLAADATPEAPRPLEDVLQELLVLVPAHLRPPLLVDSAIFFMVSEPYRPQNMSVWDAMQQLVLQAGLFLGVVGEELVLLDPPRDKITPDVTLDTDDAFSDDLGVSDTDVRNVVRVVYTDATSRERRVVEARDQWSVENITAGIEKLSVLELDATSQIDTEPEAVALASRFISDMSREFASTQLNLPFLPGLWLFDVIEMTHEKFTSLPRVFAVHSVQHTWDQTRRRTIVAGVGQVVGKRRAWLHLEPRPGSPNDPRGPHQSVLPPPIVTVEQGNPGLILNVDHRRGVDAEWVQIHWSLVPGFIPGPASLKAEGTQEKWVFNNTDVSKPDHVIPGVPHHIRVRSVDSQGNPGRWTQEITVTPAKINPNAIVLDSDVEVHGHLTIYGPRDGGGVNTGTLRFFAPGSDPDTDDPVFAVGNVGGLHGAPPGAVGAAGALGSGVWIEGAPIIAAILTNIGANVWTTGNYTAGQSVGNSPASGANYLITVPPLPEGYRAEAWWLASDHSIRYRVYDPPSIINGAGWVEVHSVRLYFTKGGGPTRANGAELRTAGFQITGVEAVPSVRFTAYRTLTGGEMQVGVAGTILVMFVPINV